MVAPPDRPNTTKAAVPSSDASVTRTVRSAGAQEEGGAQQQQQQEQQPISLHSLLSAASLSSTGVGSPPLSSYRRPAATGTARARRRYQDRLVDILNEALRIAEENDSLLTSTSSSEEESYDDDDDDDREDSDDDEGEEYNFRTNFEVNAESSGGRKQGSSGGGGGSSGSSSEGFASQ